MILYNPSFLRSSMRYQTHINYGVPYKMPKITRPLTDTEIKKTKKKDKTYKLSDGKGLYLVIKNSGSKF